LSFTLSESEIKTKTEQKKRKEKKKILRLKDAHRAQVPLYYFMILLFPVFKHETEN